MAAKILTLVSEIVLILLVVLTTVLGDSWDRVKVHRSYGAVNLFGSAAEFDPDDVIPEREELIEQLLQKDYLIKEYEETAGVPAKRVVASKGRQVIDICYELSEKDAPAVFRDYEERWEDYYLLARNGSYVYAISSRTAFRDSGIKGLENLGVQYLRES